MHDDETTLVYDETPGNHKRYVYYLAALDSLLVQGTLVCRSSQEISSKVQILELEIVYMSFH